MWTHNKFGRLILGPGLQMTSAFAGGGPDVDPAVGRVAVDLFELGGRELEPVQGGDVLLQLGDAAGPHQRRGHDRVAQRPCDRHLGQRLAAPFRDLVQGADLARFSSVSISCDIEPGWLAREPSGTPLRYRSVSIPWARGEKTMQPIPSSLRTPSRSGSIHRLSIE